MEIKFATSTQSKIADLLWEAIDMAEVNKLLRVFGIDGHIVYNMILAHTFDQITDTDLAKPILDKILK